MLDGEADRRNYGKELKEVGHYSSIHQVGDIQWIFLRKDDVCTVYLLPNNHNMIHEYNQLTRESNIITKTKMDLKSELKGKWYNVQCESI